MDNDKQLNKWYEYVFYIVGWFVVIGWSIWCIGMGLLYLQLFYLSTIHPLFSF